MPGNGKHQQTVQCGDGIQNMFILQVEKSKFTAVANNIRHNAACSVERHSLSPTNVLY